MAGRRPKPTKIKELNGWPGHHPKPEGEPEPTPDLGDCPDHLKGKAKEEWERLSPELKEIGILTVVDRATLEAYCVAYGRWRDAEIALEQSGGPTATNRFGESVVNPAFTVAHKSMEILRKVAVEFGFTPSSRSRISVKPKPKDPDGAFFEDGKVLKQPPKMGIV